MLRRSFWGSARRRHPAWPPSTGSFKGLDVATFEAEVGNWLANSGVEAELSPVPGRENLASGPRPMRYPGSIWCRPTTSRADDSTIAS